MVMLKLRLQNSNRPTYSEKNYNSHFVMQKHCIFDKRFSIDNKLVFIDSLSILTTSLDSLVRNLGRCDFKYLSQEFNGEILDLV